MDLCRKNIVRKRVIELVLPNPRLFQDIRQFHLRECPNFIISVKAIDAGIHLTRILFHSSRQVFKANPVICRNQYLPGRAQAAI